MGYDHKTPLHYVGDNNSTEFGQLLLELGAEIEAKDKNNLTPLQYAVFKNSIESVQLLLERHAEIAARCDK